MLLFPIRYNALRRFESENCQNDCFYFDPCMVKLMKRTSLISFSIRILAILLYWNICKFMLVKFTWKTAFLKDKKYVRFFSLFVTLKFGGYTFQTHTVTNPYARYPLFFQWISQNVCTVEWCLLCYFLSFYIVNIQHNVGRRFSNSTWCILLLHL